MYTFLFCLAMYVWMQSLRSLIYVKNVDIVILYIIIAIGYDIEINVKDPDFNDSFHLHYIDFSESC